MNFKKTMIFSMVMISLSAAVSVNARMSASKINALRRIARSNEGLSVAPKVVLGGGAKLALAAVGSAVAVTGVYNLKWTMEDRAAAQAAADQKAQVMSRPATQISDETAAQLAAAQVAYDESFAGRYVNGVQYLNNMFTTATAKVFSAADSVATFAKVNTDKAVESLNSAVDSATTFVTTNTDKVAQDFNSAVDSTTTFAKVNADKALEGFNSTSATVVTSTKSVCEQAHVLVGDALMYADANPMQVSLISAGTVATAVVGYVVYNSYFADQDEVEQLA